MLSTLHNRAYQDFSTLLTNFSNFIKDTQNQADRRAIEHEFANLQQWFEKNIYNLDEKGIEEAYIPRWQAIQREINREFKLLTTDVLFLASARQQDTKTKRLKNIGDRLVKLTSYCQGILKETESKQ